MSEFKFAPYALVLDENGNKIGPVKIKEAQVLAQESGLDLVEVDRQNNISICRITDRGKWLYEQKKKTKKPSHAPTLKEMRFRVRIDPHDQATKINHIHRFLEKGSDVRITVEMRGREKANKALATEKLNAILAALPEVRTDPVITTDERLSILVHPKR